MKKKLVSGFALCVAMTLCMVPTHATEASGEAVVGFEVGEDDQFPLDVQVIGYGFVMDGRQRIRTSVRYEVPTGIEKEFKFIPDEGYKLKEVIYEKPDSGYKQDLTANLQESRVVIPTVSTDMKVTVVYEKLPNKGKVNTVGGFINTGDQNDVYPYLILILGALLVFSERKYRLAVEENTNKNMEEKKMKKNKVLMTGMAALVAMPMFATSIMATDASNDGDGTNPDKTIVSYNNSTVIEDPDTYPATWGVEVPKAITFTDKVKSVRADVKLVDLSLNKTPGYPVDEVNGVQIKVQSENGYFMELSDPDEKDPLKYTLAYGADTKNLKTLKIQKETDEEIGTLYKDNPKIVGLAVKQDDALQTGNHTDRLIYTISTSVTK